MRRFIMFAPIVGLVFASCGNNPSPTLVAGDQCLEEQFGTIKCGKTPEGYEAVLTCDSVAGDYQWLVSEVCTGKCENGICIAQGDYNSPDAWPETHQKDGVGAESTELKDVKEGTDGQTDLDAKPELELFCEPNSLTCLSDTVVGKCDVTGSTWLEQPCDQGLVCDQGYCKEVICTPWELKGECVGPTSYLRCNERGTDWTVGYCEAPKTCYQGTCVDYQCPPGEVICKGMTAVQECQMNPDTGEYGWVVIEECVGGICKDGKCLSACEVNLKENTYLGCDYWAVDLDNIEGGQYEPVAVVVSVPSDQSDATITFTDMSANPPAELTPEQLGTDSMVVPSGTLKVFILPGGHDIDGSVLTNKSFRIESTSPVTVHQFNPLNGAYIYTNDASLLLPSHVGGQEYIIMSWPMRTTEFIIRGFLTIIATQPGVTKVEITPTSPVLNGPNVPSMIANPPQPYEFYLEQGDVLNIETDGEQGNDLTGTIVVSDKKINVFGGHECANIPLGVDYCDHLEQQLYPVSAWGKNYVGDAFYARNAAQQDTWRILAGADNVSITLDPPVAGPYVLNKGQWVEFTTQSSFSATGTGPFLMSHYLQGSNYSGFDVSCPNGTGIGDPAFTLAVPVEQYLDEYIVLTPNTYQEDYINIVAKLGTEGTITIDGNPVAADFIPVGSSGWGVAQVPVSDGVHTLKGEQPFGVTAYGYDCDVSYAYPGGLGLKTIQ